MAKAKNYRPDNDVPKITLERKIKAIECDNIAIDLEGRACIPQSMDQPQQTSFVSEKRMNEANMSGVSNVSVRK